MQSDGYICSDARNDSDPDHEKWTCEFCTYDNFKAAARCCMCRTARTPATKLIFENQHNQVSFPVTCNSFQRYFYGF